MVVAGRSPLSALLPPVRIILIESILGAECSHGGRKVRAPYDMECTARQGGLCLRCRTKLATPGGEGGLLHTTGGPS